MVKDILNETKVRMDKSLESLRHELVKIRTGKASTALLDTVHVDYYGTMTDLNKLANLSVLDAHTIAVQPWDKGSLPAIEKAIQSADLGLNPMNDGNLIRVPIPALNEERRRELVKLVKKFGEEAKIAVRNIRRDANDKLKKAEKEEHFSEDERKTGEKKVQDLTDDHTKNVDSMLVDKEKEIMEV
jgi:ribosome recycling factor